MGENFLETFPLKRAAAAAAPIVIKIEPNAHTHKLCVHTQQNTMKNYPFKIYILEVLFPPPTLFAP